MGGARTISQTLALATPRVHRAFARSASDAAVESGLRAHVVTMRAHNAPAEERGLARLAARWRGTAGDRDQRRDTLVTRPAEEGGFRTCGRAAPCSSRVDCGGATSERRLPDRDSRRHASRGRLPLATRQGSPRRAAGPRAAGPRSGDALKPDIHPKYSTAMSVALRQHLQDPLDRERAQIEICGSATPFSSASRSSSTAAGRSDSTSRSSGRARWQHEVTARPVSRDQLVTGFERFPMQGVEYRVEA